MVSSQLGEPQGTELVSADWLAQDPALPGCLILPLSATSCFLVWPKRKGGSAVQREGPG